MTDPGAPGEIHRASQLRDEWQRLVERRGCVVPDCHIERIGGDVFFGAVCQRALHAGRDRLDDGRVEEARVGSDRELGGEDATAPA